MRQVWPWQRECEYLLHLMQGLLPVQWQTCVYMLNSLDAAGTSQPVHAASFKQLTVWQCAAAMIAMTRRQVIMPGMWAVPGPTGTLRSRATRHNTASTGIVLRSTELVAVSTSGHNKLTKHGRKHG